ncbi:hypothetical protein GCM10028832_07800 [Streptomyces sparsus]
MSGGRFTSTIYGGGAPARPPRPAPRSGRSRTLNHTTPHHTTDIARSFRMTTYRNGQDTAAGSAVVNALYTSLAQGDVAALLARADRVGRSAGPALRRHLPGP